MNKNRQAGRKQKSKIVYIVFAAIFVIMCLLPLISMPFDKGSGNSEKRKLSTLPELFNEGMLNLDFSSQFDRFFSENFGLRSNYITAYAEIAYTLAKDSVNEKVIAGKEGWLFYYETLTDFTRADVLSAAELNSLSRNLYLQNEYLSSKGKKFIFMAAPNKNSIYGEYMPGRYPQGSGESSLEKLENLLKLDDLPYISLLSLLKEAKGGELLYHKTDTHWNNYGAMTACKSLLAEIKNIVPGYEYGDYDNLKLKTDYSWDGDLGTMLFPASQKKDLQYTFEIPFQFKYIKPIRTYEDILIETESQANSSGIFMFRDSFANALIPYISNAFGKASFSRTIPYDYSLVEKADPDVVVLEIAERNLGDILLKAPLMKAPLRNNIISGREISRDVKADIDYSKSGEFTVFSGNIEMFDPQEEKFEIYVGLVSDKVSLFYEAFPVIDIKSGNSETKTPNLNIGYSACLEAQDLQPGEYELQLLIKIGEDYIRPQFEEVKYFSAVQE